MRKRRELSAARIVLTSFDTTLPRCGITGQIAFDAVRTEDGRVVNEKDIEVHEEHVQYVIDRDVRNRCRLALQRIVPTGQSAEEARMEAERVPWKLRIPFNGNPSFIAINAVH